MASPSGKAGRIARRVASLLRRSQADLLRAGLFTLNAFPLLHFGDSAGRVLHAHIVLAIGNAPAVAPLCSRATNLDIFLYLWSLYALWFEWKSSQENSFVGFLCIEIVKATILSLPKRCRAAKDEEETGKLITLIGLLAFLGVTFDRPSAVEDFASRLPSLAKMIERLDEDRPFIPSFFYLLGLEWLYQKDQGVPAFA